MLILFGGIGAGSLLGRALPKTLQILRRTCRLVENMITNLKEESVWRREESDQV